jgi:CRP/FNR family cyclic AMP-dependent transcriptional regulator
MLPAVELSSRREDLLMHLPRKPVQSFSKGQLIYHSQQPSESLYIVVTGRVKVAYTADHGDEAIARMVRTEGLFGESCLIGGRPEGEIAVALESTTLMAWTCGEVEQQIEKDPRLGLLLAQYMVRECIELQDRIESSASYKTPERVMLAIVQLAADLGVPIADGSLRLPSLTHHTIAEYVGTSREIVTFHMNRLRRLGMLKYSRKCIDVNLEVLQEELRQRGVALPQSMRKMNEAVAV